MLFFNDNADSLFLRQLLIFLTTTVDIFNDNRDNRNNGKNGRNCGCHEVTYNTDNRDYLCYYGCPRCLCCRLKIKPSPRLMVLEDNRDNNNNRKNGRNIECHEVT